MSLPGPAGMVTPASAASSRSLASLSLPATVFLQAEGALKQAHEVVVTHDSLGGFSKIVDGSVLWASRG